jgi:hypothetical protein
MLFAKMILVCLCFDVVGAFVGSVIAQEIELPGQKLGIPHSPEETACAEKGMKHVIAPQDAGTVCEPQGIDVLSRITNCLSVGMEAVLIPDRMGVVCARPFKGTVFLKTAVLPFSEEKRYQPPEITDSESICKLRADKRVLDLRIIKELFRKSATTIDTIGIRIIGGIYCDGVDLNGLDIPFSLILDRSIFRGRVNVRNFRTKGDLSLDNSVMYGSVLINRAEISGSVYATSAFIRGKMDISDSVVKGSVRLNHSVMVDLLNIENLSVEGDLDMTTSFVSHLEVLKDRIGGVLDLSQSQARCTYDIRKNEIGDLVAVQLGFGTLRSSASGSAVYTFKKISRDPAFGRPLPPAQEDSKPLDDPFDLYTTSKSETASAIQDNQTCDVVNFIKPGTFVLVDNHIKSSLCIRAFNWLTDPGNNPQQSNIYFNEDTIGGATWLNITRTQTASSIIQRQTNPSPSEPKLSIFNVRTGTLVLDFDLTVQNVSLTVNGLHFERIYDSRADCESALSLRSSEGAPRAEEIAFPPVLKLPNTDQVIDWINKNRFAGTQQPFAEFVAVFEQAGDSEGAKDLKIRAAIFAFRSSVCDLFGFSWSCAQTRTPDSDTEINPPYSTQQGYSVRLQQKTLPELIWSVLVNGVSWFENLVLALLNLMLWVLADFGYRPERIGWFVFGTVLSLLFVFPYCLGIVGYSVETSKDRIKPISILFLFDRLLPAYRIREEHYNIEHYYVVSKKAGDLRPRMFRHLGKKWLVVQATEQQREKIERYLDLVRFSGLVFTIFILAAVSKLTR